MKKSLIKYLLLALVVMSACRKSDNATMPDGIVYLNQPQIIKVTGGDPAILDTDPLSFRSEVELSLYFENSDKPDHLNLVVVKNGDAKNAKVLKENISTFPTKVELTGENLTALFGTISAGDSFDIGADYYLKGKKYAAFPEGGGLPYGAGVSSQPDRGDPTNNSKTASPTVRYSAICGFVADDFIGNGQFEVIEDKWADYAAGQPVQITKISETSFSLQSPNPGFADYIITVDPRDNSAKMASQVTAADGAFWYGANVGSVTLSTGGASSASFVNPCNNELQLNIQFVLSLYGNQGSYLLKLKKR